MKQEAKRQSQTREEVPFPTSRAGFYRAFEDRFRGSRELIRSRLEVYLPFIEPLKQTQTVVEAVDLGCGRGEWLQLLGDHGFRARGVDLDEGMLESCRKRGLQATKGHAISYLRDVPDNSLAIVSAFHVAEHLLFEELYQLVLEAHRALIPSGLLILETPNPENIRVSTLSFHLDPTHLKPLPPDLLSFLTEYIGFRRNKIIRLQEEDRVSSSPSISLAAVLGSASPDYAILAQKEGNSDMSIFDEAFNKEYGLHSSVLIERFDEALREQANKQEKLQSSIEAEHDARLDLELRLDSVQSKISDIYSSTSWRITAPLRTLADSTKWLVRGSWAWLTLKPGSRPRRVAKPILVKSARYVLARPKLARPLKRALQRMPVLDKRLRVIIASTPSFFASLPNAGNSIEDLSPRGRAIHRQLSEAIEKRRRES